MVIDPPADGAPLVQTVRSPDPRLPIRLPAPALRNGAVELRIEGAAVGALYALESAETLANPVWRTIAAGASDLEGAVEFRGLAAGGSTRFYRLRRE